MIKIDLLKGTGLPTKSRPISTAVIALLVLAPILGVAPFVYDYLHAGVLLQTQQAALASYGSQIEQLKEARAFLEQTKLENARIDESLTEIANCIGVHSQWSSVLVAVADSVPDSLSISYLNLMRQSSKTSMPAPLDPESTIMVPTYQFTLEIGTEDGPENAEAIKQFVQALRSSEVLAPRLDDCLIKSSPAQGGDDYVSYEVQCVFKTKVAGV